jgi:uncharacterized protein (DUF2336 family)
MCGSPDDRPQNVVKRMNATTALAQEIEYAVADASPERCAGIARHITDLYLPNVERFSADEIALFDDIFVRLATTIEESARALLAMRLAPVSKAPPNTIRILALDDAIDVASAVLIQSEILDDPALIECAKTKSQEHLLAMSMRRRLSEAVTDLLVERGDWHVVLSTAKNAGAKFSDKGFAILVERSNADDALALCVGRRPDIPERFFTQLLAAASAAVRAKLEAESPHYKPDIHRVVAEVTARIEDQTAVHPQKFAAAKVLVESLNLAGKLNGSLLEAFAKANRFEDTVAALAVMVGVPISVVDRKLNDEFVAFIVVLARAIDLSWATTLRLLELGARLRRCTAREIDNGLNDFQNLKRRTALQILGAYRAQKMN